MRGLRADPERSLVELLHPTLVPAIARASFPVEAREDLPSHLVLDRLRGFFTETGNRVRASTPFFQYVSKELYKKQIDASEAFQHVVVVMLETEGAAEYLINERTQSLQSSVRLVSTAIAEKWKVQTIDYKLQVAEHALCALAEAEIQALANHALSLVRVPICAHSRVASLLLIMAAQGGAEWRKAAYERVPLDCKSLSFVDFEELSERVRNDPHTLAVVLSKLTRVMYDTESERKFISLVFPDGHPPPYAGLMALVAASPCFKAVWQMMRWSVVWTTRTELLLNRPMFRYKTSCFLVAMASRA